MAIILFRVTYESTVLAHPSIEVRFNYVPISFSFLLALTDLAGWFSFLLTTSGVSH